MFAQTKVRLSTTAPAIDQAGASPLLAVVKPNKEDGRPDGQDVEEITDGAANGNNEAKTDSEPCRIYHTDCRNQRGRKHLLSPRFNWSLANSQCAVKTRSASRGRRDESLSFAYRCFE